MTSGQIKSFGEISRILVGVEATVISAHSDLLEAYYDAARHADPDALSAMIEIYEANTEQADSVVANMILNGADENVLYLARAIMLSWLLGSWYAPDGLKRSPENHPVPSVISAKAYIHGLVWQVIGAQPMGYSDRATGHWMQPPEIDWTYGDERK